MVDPQTFEAKSLSFFHFDAMSTQRGKDLVNGYIREIEYCLISKQIVPSAINKICFQFYYTSNILYCLVPIYYMQKFELLGYHFDNKTKFKYNIYDLNNQSQLINAFAFGYGSVFLAKDVSLPTDINTKCCKLSNNNNLVNKYHVMFKNGGSVSAGSSALIFNPLESHNTG